MSPHPPLLFECKIILNFFYKSVVVSRLSKMPCQQFLIYWTSLSCNCLSEMWSKIWPPQVNCLGLMRSRSKITWLTHYFSYNLTIFLQWLLIYSCHIFMPSLSSSRRVESNDTQVCIERSKLKLALRWKVSLGQSGHAAYYTIGGNDTNILKALLLVYGPQFKRFGLKRALS